ncbi:PAS domain-containing protein [Brevundimonas vitis]|uniref:histidine kinase n=1 Tax=Brevundimonas vitisensis TaxID=2800818 RepID=A0ABX7BX68_9CAUL|nr:PAS domain-containing protein [Brevundimonas vitisensis]QQQ20100.1 PAS domain-containing protein [Brevundimonas vitisensis]
MSAESPPFDEQARLAALYDFDILDSGRERAFDDLAALIASICDAPIAVINLIAADRQWFKAEVGLGVDETPLETSFCRHALLQNDHLIVRDTTEDPRFNCNPLVLADGGIRFYAGVLLKTDEGLPLGTLCVLDTRPRPDGLTPLQMQALETLSRQTMDLMKLRRAVKAERRSAEVLAATASKLSDSEARFRVIADSMPQMVWSTLPDGFHDYYNARWYEFTGTPVGSTDGEGWAGMFHPEDQARAWARWTHSLKTGELYEIEYRLRRHDGIYRWTLGRAAPIRDEDGRIIRWFGTCTDIDDLKKIDEAKELLSQELSHRIKNIFAVISALVALSARQFPEAKGFAKSLRTRINALAQAHEFVRPHSEVSKPHIGNTTLHDFLAALFKAYAGSDGAPRVVISGDNAVFDDQAATSVALLFHEMATNASKYGALSNDQGYITLDTRAEGDRFILVWTEHDGPPIHEPPTRAGFGSSLATLSVEGQLGGRLERQWLEGGLRVVADLPATALSRRRAAQNVA